MKTKIAIYAILIFFIVIIQSTVLDYIEIYDIKPNLLIVFIICVALLRGNVEGSIIGFFVGLSQDIISGKVLGFYTILGLYLGLIIGSVNKRLYRENFLVIIFFTFVASISYEFVTYFLSTFMNGRIDFYYPIKSIILPEALYNSIISIFMYILMIKLNDRFNKSKVSRKY